MVIAERLELHDELNPILWDEHSRLHEDVAHALDEIADHFVSSMDVPINVADVIIVGSQASYNYTEHSDIDLHIVCNYELVSNSPEILQIAYDSVRSKFNSEYDLTVKGIDVELYVQDIKSTTVSNGVYSLMDREWIKYPEKLLNAVEVHDTDEAVAHWRSKAETALNLRNSEKVEDVINQLYLMRKNSISTEGEYGFGNQVFKDIRNLGLLDELKSAYKKFKSKELSLEHYRLNEDSRQSLLGKSKRSTKGMQRYKQRVKSRVANSVKQYNSIDMNKLFKDDILTVEVNVHGETDDYIVKISFGGFLELLRDQLRAQNNELNYKAITRALILGFNKDDVYINCQCPDWQYRYAYYATRNKINSGAEEHRASDITNPDDSLGSACKHVLLVLSNTSWLLKVGATIHNYIKYMMKHHERLYTDIIYPAIYGVKYEEPVQLDLFDTEDELQTDKDVLDRANTHKGRDEHGRFISGNEYQYKEQDNKAPEIDDDQLTIDAEGSSGPSSVV